jgi:DNA polymerase-1
MTVATDLVPSDKLDRALQKYGFPTGEYAESVRDAKKRMREKVDLGSIIRDPRAAMAAFRPGEWIALDLETGGLSPWKDPLAVISMHGRDSGTTAVIHCRGYIPPDLKTWMSSPDRKFITHNGGGFDCLFLARNGIDVYKPQFWDTLVSESVTATSGRRDVRVSLQASLARRLGVNITKKMGTSPWMQSQLSDEQLDYCANDIRYLHDLQREHIVTAVDRGRQLDALELEMRLLKVIVKMEMTGLPLDLGALQTFLEFQERQFRDDQTWTDQTFGSFNPNSAKQVNTLFKNQGIELPDTKAETLTIVAEADDTLHGRLAAAVIRMRQARKRTGMYDDEWLMKYLIDGRVHSRFWQVGTETGRFSCTDPNLQQIPRDARGVFGGLPGHTIVAADYDQIEVVIAAALAKDARLLSEITNGDVHMNVASTVMYHRPVEEITREMRRTAKAGVFTWLFCGGWKTFQSNARLQGLHMSDEEARRYTYDFLKTHPGVDSMRNKAFAMKDRGGSCTLNFPTGLRRVLTGPKLRAQIMVNNVVQGTAAAGLKYGLLDLDSKGLVEGYVGASVHDENVACVPDAMAKEYEHELLESMTKGMKRVIDAPVSVESKTGSHWK